MKRLLTAVLLLATISVKAQKPVKLKIVYFHLERRCPTCISIEENTKKTLKDGSITLQVLNAEDPKNQKIVEKYKAEGSALYLTKVNGINETTTDFTNFAFSYSRNQSEKFIAGLKAEIEKNLR